MKTAPQYSAWLLLSIALAFYVSMGVALFGLAGRMDLPWFWAALAAFAISHMSMAMVVRRDANLIRERVRPGPGEPLWDRVVLSLSGLVIAITFVVAPLDVGQYHWSDTVPPALQIIGLIGLPAGMALMTWAMAVNTFFSKVVRIQEDRDRRVITTGPYRFVRHPGYVGWILLWTSFCLTLGSWIGFGCSLLVTLLVVLRTALEDRFLKRDLPGYADYARRVRFRLLPGIW